MRPLLAHGERDIAAALSGPRDCRAPPCPAAHSRRAATPPPPAASIGKIGERRRHLFHVPAPGQIGHRNQQRHAPAQLPEPRHHLRLRKLRRNGLRPSSCSPSSTPDPPGTPAPQRQDRAASAAGGTAIPPQPPPPAAMPHRGSPPAAAPPGTDERHQHQAAQAAGKSASLLSSPPRAKAEPPRGATADP